MPAGRLGQRVDSRSAACPSRRRPDARRPADATAVGSPPGRGPAPAGADRADRAPRCGRRLPSDSSAPNTVRTSSSLAASANRTTPYSPSWSVSAMARRSSRAASSTSSSGVLAPSRKLYAECACSSAYGDGRADAPGFVAAACTLPRLRDQAGRLRRAGCGWARRHGAACRRAPAPFPPSSAAH